MTNVDVAIASTEAVLEWDGLQTWYRIVGDLDASSGLTPVVVVHGGPGATHDYLEPMSELARGAGRASSTTRSGVGVRVIIGRSRAGSGQSSCSCASCK